MLARIHTRAHTQLMRNMLKWKIRVIRALPQQIGSELLCLPASNPSKCSNCSKLVPETQVSIAWQPQSLWHVEPRMHARMHACVRAGLRALTLSSTRLHCLNVSGFFCCRWLQPWERRALSHYCSQALRAGCRPHRGILGFWPAWWTRWLEGRGLPHNRLRGQHDYYTLHPP